MKNFAEIKFTNAILLDILGKYTDNSVLAAVVSESGEFNMKFKVNPPVEPPKNTEQVLSLIYALFESNSDTPVGQAFVGSQKDILRETVYRLSEVLNGFSDVKLVINTTETGENGAEVTKETVTTLTRNNVSS